jgi:tetratricopeptide (TPR) repeat protein
MIDLNQLNTTENNNLSQVRASQPVPTTGYFGTIEEERAFYEGLLESDPKSSYACYGLGDIFCRQGQYESAKVMLEWSVVYNSGNMAAKNALAKANMMLGLDADDNSLVQPEDKAGSDVNQLLKDAAALLAEQNFADALLKLNMAEGLFNGHISAPDDKEFAASFFNLKGFVLLGLNELQDAKELFEKALNLNPSSSQACTGLAEILYLEGLNSSKIMFEWGVKNNPENLIAVKGLKKVNQLLGLPDNDLQSNSVSEGQTGLDELLEQTYTLFEQKKYKEALDALTIAEKLLPENDMKLRSAIESLRGFSYLGLSELQNAKHFFERALYDEPDSSDACAGLGEVFHLLGFDNEAKTMFEWAVQYNPGNKFAKAGLLKVNQALGYTDHHNSLADEFN